MTMQRRSAAETGDGTKIVMEKCMRAKRIRTQIRLNQNGERRSKNPMRM